MKQRIPKWNDYVNAIIDRDKNVIPYSEIEEKYEIKPHQFFKAVFTPIHFFKGVKKLSDLVSDSEEGYRQILEAIDSDTARKIELFRMGELFVAEQYNKTLRRMPGETQKILYPGTLMQQDNRGFLVYHAITSANPTLKSRIEDKDRSGVISEIRGLPHYLRDYFQCNLALGGVMNKFEKGKKNSALGVLELFDTLYQQKTGDASLFDLYHKEHLHKWSENFKAPRHYWQNPANVEEAVYHTLTEKHPELLSDDRKVVVTGILSFPDDLSAHFSTLGLCGLLKSALNHSPQAVLEVFDRVYRRVTEDISLFDRRRTYHIEFDGRNRLIRRAA